MRYPLDGAATANNLAMRLGNINLGFEVIGLGLQPIL